MNSKQVALIGGSGFIGYHLTIELQARGFQVEILDLKSPGTHFPPVIFKPLDLLNKKQVREILVGSNYGTMINLAAITNDKSPSILDYLVNFEGCKNLVDILEELNSECRFIQISTQYVQKPISKGVLEDSPKAMNAYGESKKRGEEILKKSKLKNWVILRPTNVWGRYHPGFPQGFWRMMRKGFYVHPNRPVIRSYGYVGGVCNQIVQFAALPESTALRKVYYVGDDPIDSYIWVNAFSKELRGKNVRVVPSAVILAASIFGEFLQKLGLNFPLNLKRYKSMTTDYIVDMEPTWKVITKPNQDFDKSVNETAEWYLGAKS